MSAVEPYFPEAEPPHLDLAQTSDSRAFVLALQLSRDSQLCLKIVGFARNGFTVSDSTAVSLRRSVFQTLSESLRRKIFCTSSVCSDAWTFFRKYRHAVQGEVSSKLHPWFRVLDLFR